MPVKSDPKYRGPIILNGVQLSVINSAVFSGVLHWRFMGATNGQAIFGWAPACLCNIP